MGLFKQVDEEMERQKPRPLADRMRPETLEEILGQEHILAPGKPLRTQIEKDQLSSLILWGPPGSGKTTLAHVIARMTRSEFMPFSAVLAGIKEIKAVMAEAERARRLGHRTILLVDEIHRFNKAQQDAFLPYVEKGDIILIGATTENPSFEVISALLSRSRVYALNPLTPGQIVALLHRALADERRGLGGKNIDISDDLLRQNGEFAGGAARVAYNTLEAAAVAARPAPGGRPPRPTITTEIVQDAIQRRVPLYDKAGEQHYNLISALHKSVRNSDPDAAMYWLARMLESGEDLMYIARRLIRMASEDIGLADPRALEVAVAAMQAAHFVGMPEGNLALAEAAVYLAMAPKSNALYTGYGEARGDAERTAAEPVPLHLRNPVTALMKEFGYGKGYQYAHNLEEKVAPDMPCLPERLAGRRYYLPTDQGLEARIRARLEQLKRRLSPDREPEPGGSRQ
jgi:putative ATPase